MIKEMNICTQANKYHKIKTFFQVPNNENLVVEKCSRVSHNPLDNLSC